MINKRLEKYIDLKLHELEFMAYDLEDVGEEDEAKKLFNEYKIWKQIKEDLIE